MSSRNVFVIVAAIAGIALSCEIRAQTISTYAGGGAFVDAPALSISAPTPQGTAIAPDGTVYYSAGNSVYHLNPGAATVTLVAGNGTPGYSGDGGPATSAQLYSPVGVAIDTAGNLYIADSNNQVIRRVDASSGTITTAAGNGTPGYSGNGGPATSAQLTYPSGVAVDAAGNLYIADSNNNVIRRVDAASGTITTVAGVGTQGYSGDTGLATSAQLHYPTGVAVDAGGNLYIADLNNAVIRRVDASSGTITTAAGTGTPGYSGDSGPATSAELSYPHDVTVDAAGNLYIADTNNLVIRRVDASSGTITTVAGNHTYGYSGDGQSATAAQLTVPYGVAVDPGGNLYIADTNNNVIRRVDASSGTITTAAGNGTPGYSGDGGPATSAQLYSLSGVAVDAAGNLFIADSGNNVIRRVDASSGTITTAAGNGTPSYGGDGGPATSAQLNYPYGVAVDAAGNLFIADYGNDVIRRVDASSGTISTVAGNHTSGYSGDGGPATNAQLSGPLGVAVDAADNLYIDDLNNNVIRRIDSANGTITTVAGNNAYGYSGDGGLATSAELYNPYGVAVDAAGNLYIADSYNFAIRRVDASSGKISTVAGNHTSGYSGNGGPATRAQLTYPDGVALDAAGNLYIGDTANEVVRRVDASSGTITTVAGNNAYGYSGDGGPATSAELSSPLGVAVDAAAKLYISDPGNARIRVMSVATSTFTATPSALNFGNEPAGNTSAPMLVTVKNTGNVPLALTIARSGTNPAQFSQTKTCGTSVAVSSTCKISVVFKPTATGAKSAALNINGGGAGTQTVALSGTGVASYTVSTTSVPFGNVPHGTTSGSQSVTVTNTSTVALPIRTIKLSGTNPGQFSQTNTCGTSVAASATCTISVVFKPTVKGLKTATLSVNAGGGAGTKTVALSGTGT